MQNKEVRDDQELITDPYLVALLGGLIALSATAIDICLPALLPIAVDLSTNVNHIQLVISLYLAGFAFGQLIWGIASDHFGRKPCLIFGLSIFLVVSLLCALIESATWLVALRFLQGLVGASAPVITRAIVRDIAGGVEGAKLMATLTSILGMAPLLAPLVGGVIVAVTSWRIVFLLIFCFSFILLVGVFVRLRETRKREGETSFHAETLFQNIKAYYTHPECRYGMLLLGSAWAGYLSLIGGVGPLLMDVYGFSSTTFGLVFACAALSFAIGSWYSRKRVVVFGVPALLRLGVIVIAVSSFGLLALSAIPSVHWIVIWLAIAAYNLGAGLLLPNATAISLEPVPHIAGLAASLLGFTQLGFGAVSTTLSAVLYQNDHVVLCAVMGICGMLSVFVYRRHQS